MIFKEGNIIAEHYVLKKQLGQGSFGDVWLAHNMLADIDVAIKFYGTLDKKGIEDFRNEFKIAYRLHHPNLLNISHFDVFENCPYLVMPFCENGSVSHRIGKLPECEIWKFVHDVSCGLAFLHSQNPPIIHQDIKPDNILITSDGRYVISDFGISRSFRTQMSRTNNKVNSSGTLAYMGPERFSENPMIILASDIWAFGMTLYEIISGDVLWEGMGGCVQLNGARIPAISTSPELSRLVKACLSQETWNRPTAQQIYDYASAKMRSMPLPPLSEQESQKNETQTVEIRKSSVPVNHQIPTTPTISGGKKTDYSPSKVYIPQKSSSSLFTKGGTFSKRILLAIAAIVGVIIVGVGVMYFHNSIEEEQDFLSCKTKEDFERFIKEHPSSSYVSVARKRIETIQPSTQKSSEPSHETIPNKTRTAPIQTIIKEKIQEIEQPTQVTQEKKKADDRILFESANNNPTPKTTQQSNLNEDDVFYACQTIGDFQSYLNTFPNGRHRAQAQAAINNMLNRDDNTVNDNEPYSDEIQTHNSVRQNLPPKGYRNNSPSGFRPRSSRGSRPPRNRESMRRHFR